MVYVIIQFSCIIYLVSNTHIAEFNPFSMGLILIGVITAGSAFLSMRFGSFNILPDLKAQHQLTTTGIYRFIRHPMYSSILLLCLGLLLSNATVIAQIVFIILFADLILKSKVEEKLLSQRFDEYQNYRKNTGMFFPRL